MRDYEAEVRVVRAVLREHAGDCIKRMAGIEAELPAWRTTVGRDVLARMVSVVSVLGILAPEDACDVGVLIDWSNQLIHRALAERPTRRARR